VTIKSIKEANTKYAVVPTIDGDNKKNNDNRLSPPPPLSPPIKVSSNTTVVGMGGGYDLKTYRRFVGSLRSTGYDGHILLGVSSSVYYGRSTRIRIDLQHQKNGTTEYSGATNDDEPTTDAAIIRNYLLYQGVQMFEMRLIECTYAADDTNNETVEDKRPPTAVGGKEVPLVPLSPSISMNRRCLHPYPKIKLGWSSYLLARDWLTKCQGCTGSTILTSIPNVIFQHNPFSSSTTTTTTSTFKGLHLFEEHPSFTTENWRVAMPLRRCKSFVWDVPLLSSDIVIGEYHFVVSFIEVVEQEMEVWMETVECGVGDSEDDDNIGRDGMALVNFLFYDGVLGRRLNTASSSEGGSDSSSITIHRHRMGVVHTVMGDADVGGRTLNGDTDPIVVGKDDTNNDNSWLLSSSYHHENGYLLDRNGNQSTIIHGINSLGTPFLTWLDQKPFMKMMIPSMAATMSMEGGGSGGNTVRLGSSSDGNVVKGDNQKSPPFPEFHDSTSSVYFLQHAMMENFNDRDKKTLQDWVIQHGEDELETYYSAYDKSEEE